MLGAYSETWPLDCPKSERIVRDFADYLAKPDSPIKGFRDRHALPALDRRGEGPRAGAEVGAAAPPIGRTRYAWYLGYGGIPLCEYYLRTGDQEVLPGIQKWVDNAVKAASISTAGLAAVASRRVTYGNGHLNAGGTAVVTFLLLAKECGATFPIARCSGR